jgi:hypothetical protein
MQDMPDILPWPHCVARKPYSEYFIVPASLELALRHQIAHLHAMMG